MNSSNAPPKPTQQKQPPAKSRRLRFQQRRENVLVFSPLAWLKLQMFLHAGETEVGGFGISSEHDLLYIHDFVTLEQVTSAVSVEFADDAVANYFDQCVDAGVAPARFARIWCHTHPGQSADPSSTDEETFARVFGSCDWALMFILSRTGRTYARLSFNAGPGGSIQLPVGVDWEQWPSVVMKEQARMPDFFEDWMKEFDRNIHPYQPVVRSSDNLSPSLITVEDWWDGLMALREDERLDVLDQSELADAMDTSAGLEADYAAID